jgi:hypothetical protein|tara:strand:- start:239 stop:907 length:669 start_codon:yes stop_codon:yes gene_type:complete
MANFGATTDPWSFADTTIHLVSYTNPTSGSNAQSEDSQGTVLCETVFDTGTSPSATYRVCKGGTASFTGFELGKVISSKIITSITASRSNKEELEITIAGENMVGDSGAVVTPVFPTGYLAGGKNAIEAGVVSSAGRVISSSVTNTIQVAKGLDSLGNQVCKEVYGARAETTNEFTTCDTDPAWVADTANSWALQPNNSPSEDNSSYPSATGGAFQNLALDT